MKDETVLIRISKAGKLELKKRFGEVHISMSTFVRMRIIKIILKFIKNDWNRITLKVYIFINVAAPFEVLFLLNVI